MSADATIIRSVCLFTESPSPTAVARLKRTVDRLLHEGYVVQTQRILSPVPIKDFDILGANPDLYFSVGAVTLNSFQEQSQAFVDNARMSCHLDLTRQEPDESHVQPLFDLIKTHPEKTFYFAYSVLPERSSPFFPSASYHRAGFSIGLQPTNLARGCSSLEEWCSKMSVEWERLLRLVGNEPDFLGLDSSTAPLGGGDGSLLKFVESIYGSFHRAQLSDFFVRLTEFIKTQNPAPVGLCGLMLPCLEDFVLAERYEQGKFDLTTNLALSLHSGLGIDTYPIGIDEDPAVVLDVLRLTRRLALKHRKTLAVRFVSDGKAQIGQRTDFGNEYLIDVTVRSLTPVG